MIFNYLIYGPVVKITKKHISRQFEFIWYDSKNSMINEKYDLMIKNINIYTIKLILNIIFLFEN